VGETARPPDCISIPEHRDHPRRSERWFRWLLVSALAILALLGLANVFGQKPSEARATGSGASLAVSAPNDLRGGLYFQGRFEVAGERDLEQPTLVLSPDWFDGIHLNTIEPEPTGTTPENGGVGLEYDTLPAGEVLTVYLELQVNPTTMGRRAQWAELRDGDRTLARVERPVTIFP
jgi:hypothetical protein